MEKIKLVYFFLIQANGAFVNISFSKVVVVMMVALVAHFINIRVSKLWLTSCLFLQIKFYWNKATPIHLHSSYGYFTIA